MSIMPQDPDSKTSHPPITPACRGGSHAFCLRPTCMCHCHQPSEAQQDDGCSCGSTALLTHDHDPSCTLVRCRRCGMDLPDHLPGDDHCRPCTRPHLDAARPPADTETLRDAWAEGYSAAQRDAEDQPYSDRPERATWKPTANPYGGPLAAMDLPDNGQGGDA